MKKPCISKSVSSLSEEIGCEREGLCVSHRDFHLAQIQPVISVALLYIKSALRTGWFSSGATLLGQAVHNK